MAAEYSHYEKDGVFVLSIVGEISVHTINDINEYTQPILDEIKEQDSIRGLVIDLEKLKFMDSSGIGWICGRMVRLKKQSKKMVLCNVNDEIYPFFKMAGIHTILQIFETVEEALAEMNPDAAG